MTIDEAIERFKYDAECNRADLDLSYAEDNEQIAEWLEELKELRKIKEDYSKGMQTSYATFMYNKAIDDFANVLKENYDYLPQILSQEAFGLYIDEYAEQLKVGEMNDNLRR